MEVTKVDGEFPWKSCTADIFTYTDDRLQRLESYQRTVLEEGPACGIASRLGPKIVAVILNPQEEDYGWEEISSLESLMRMKGDLKHERLGKLTMTGCTRLEAGSSSTMKIPVRPLVSEIEIRSIRCDLNGTPYRGHRLEEAVAYLSGVNTCAGLFSSSGIRPEAPVNTDGRHTESDAEMDAPGLLVHRFKAPIGPEREDCRVKLYCYPNEAPEDAPGSPFTRLVIEGKIGGSTCFYPIDINRGDFPGDGDGNGISRNRRYSYDITILKKGLPDPSGPALPQSVLTRCTVLDWEDGGDHDILF